MQLLLDTCTFIWWIAGDPTLTAVARAPIADPNNQCFVSAASAWEISTKYRLGKLPQAAPLAANFAGEAFRNGFIPLPITAVHASHAGAFTQPHRDPFDRMIAAQAFLEGMPVASPDRQLDQFGIVRIW